MFISWRANDCVASMVYQGKVLEPLGAITSGSQFLEPDGNTNLEDSYMVLRVLKYLVSESRNCLFQDIFPITFQTQKIRMQ